MKIPEFQPPARILRLVKILAVLGAATLGAGLLVAPERAWMNLLLAAFYLVGLGLAGVLFIAIQYVTGAGWCVAFRRVPEAMAGTLPAAALLVAAVLAGVSYIYPWTHGFGEHGGPALWFKEAWLSPLFFAARGVVYLLVWIAFAAAIVRTSRRQDDDRDVSHTRRNVRLSAAFLVVFGVTFWLASYDWLMSLEPHWYSTVFGVYQFAGVILSGLAMITILAIWLHRLGPLRDFLTAEHLHDLGKLLFAFSTFWMYIWFCQFMLIWYANIPEETSHFIIRLEGFWQPVFWLNILLNWAVPFLVLLHIPAKRSPGMLLKISWTILVGRWVDLYLMVAPPFAGENPVFGVWEVGIMAGAAGLFFLAAFRALRRAPAVPLGDPYLEESLSYHN